MVIDCNKICEWINKSIMSIIDYWKPEPVCEGCPCCMEKTKKKK
jgi:hypothetical protein